MRIGFVVIGRRRRGAALAVALASAAGIGACGGEPASASAGGEDAAAASQRNERGQGKVAAGADSAAGGPARRAARGRVLIVGTSLTAGLGLEPEEAYPAVLAEKIDSAGLPFEVVNAGVSGETSSGALRRIDWLLREPVDVLVLETGANDGLRGVPVATLRANIEAIVRRVRESQPEARILLVQMEALPNFGPEYTGTFRLVYPQVARSLGVTLVPFLLEGVAGVPRLNQPDGIHPTAEGARMAAATIWRTLGPVLVERAGARAPGALDAAPTGQ